MSASRSSSQEIARHSAMQLDSFIQFTVWGLLGVLWVGLMVNFVTLCFYMVCFREDFIGLEVSCLFFYFLGGMVFYLFQSSRDVSGLGL